MTAGETLTRTIQVHDPEERGLRFLVKGDLPTETRLDEDTLRLEWPTKPEDAGGLVSFTLVTWDPEDPEYLAWNTFTILVIPPEGGPASLFDSTGDGIPDLLDPCPEHFTPSSDPSQCQFMAAGGSEVIPRPRIDDPEAGVPDRSDSSGDGVPDHVSSCPSGGCPSDGGGGNWDSSGDGIPDQMSDCPAGDCGAADATDTSGDGIPDRHSKCPHLYDPLQQADDDCRLPQPCPPQETAAGEVFALPGADGTVTVAWTYTAPCQADGFLVWAGAGERPLGSVPHEPGTVLHFLRDSVPWTDRVTTYHVQVILPGQSTAFDPERAVASNVINLRPTT